MDYFKEKFKGLSMKKVVDNYFVLEKTLFKINEQMQFQNINEVQDKLRKEKYLEQKRNKNKQNEE